MDYLTRLDLKDDPLTAARDYRDETQRTYDDLLVQFIRETDAGKRAELREKLARAQVDQEAAAEGYARMVDRDNEIPYR